MPAASISPAAFTSASLRPLRRPSARLPPPRPSFRPRRVACDAVVSTSEAAPSSTTAELTPSPEEQEALGKVGSRVRVTAALKVYHVPKVPEVDLAGREGVIKQYVPLWKGKRISANLPFKVEFVVPEGIGERPGPVKFVAHLREDEFEYVAGG